MPGMFWITYVFMLFKFARHLFIHCLWKSDWGEPDHLRIWVISWKWKKFVANNGQDSHSSWRLIKSHKLPWKPYHLLFGKPKLSCGLKLENVTIFGIERGHLEAMQSFTFSFTAAVPENLKCLVAKSLT